ncbi:putative UvrD-type helicase [Vibrio phage RYC]|nr:putative UvrD-type helicase [Vibrio phage RYC]
MRKGFGRKAKAASKVVEVKKRFPPTEQQKTGVAMVVEHELSKITAGAGSGKTSVLELIADEITTKTLYLAYNKSMATEAAERFPDHVECRTTHSIAFQYTGRAIAGKLSRPKGRYVNVAGNGREIAIYFKIPDIPNPEGQALKSRYLGMIVRDTVNKFEYSSAKDVSTDHIPRNELSNIKKRFPALNIENIKKMIVRYAQNLWDERKDPTSPVLATHDTYLKLFQLKGIILEEYKNILLDEAQDANDCTLSIFGKQKHAKRVLVGDKYQQLYCQPAGTKVLVSSENPSRGRNGSSYILSEKNIEDITTEDKVVSYSLAKSYIRRTGSEVNKVGKRWYEGYMYTVEDEEGCKSSYTEDHEVLVKGGRQEGKYLVYLMENHKNQFRIGMTSWCKSENFGPSHRTLQEKAKNCWVLEYCHTRGEAKLRESLISNTFNIPEVCFKNHARSDRELNGEVFWENYNNPEGLVAKCLDHYNLDRENPHYSQGKAKGGRATEGITNVTLRKISRIPARNLLEGMLVCKESLCESKKVSTKAWVPVKISKDWYEGYVYSLEVEEHETYFADGFLTHNCFRGSVNALEKVNCPESFLTKSFRFGEEIGWIATTVLLGEMKVEGFDKVKSRVGMSDVIDYDKPYTILFRTNMSLIFQAVDMLTQGEDINVNFDTRDFADLLKSARALREDDQRAIKHEAIIPFSNWEELRDEADGSAEIKRLVEIIEGNEDDRVLSVLNNYERKGSEKITLTTAHKSKGLEFEQVVLSNDFPSNYDHKGKWIGLNDDERNLLYVACTRAKSALQLNDTVFEIIERKTGGIIPDGLNISLYKPEDREPDSFKERDQQLEDVVEEAYVEAKGTHTPSGDLSQTINDSFKKMFGEDISSLDNLYKHME